MARKKVTSKKRLDTRTYRVSVQIIRAYELDVTATDHGAACNLVYDMDSKEIDFIGKLMSVETDYVEIV